MTIPSEEAEGFVSSAPLERQVGGAHYKGWRIQPVELWAANGYDAFVGAALKYILRWRDKGGEEDLYKAIHYIELREELDARTMVKLNDRKPISVSKFCTENELSPRASDAVIALDGYSEGLLPAEAVISNIRRMMGG